MFQRLTELYGPYEIVRQGETKGKGKTKEKTKEKTKGKGKTNEKTETNELKQLKTEAKQQSIITVDYIDNN
jgi:hypothetical protein